MARADIKPLPSQERLRELFDYDPETGALTWKIKPYPQAGRVVIGREAGTITKGRSQYRTVGIRESLGGKFTVYLAHRLIWKWMTGDDPPECVDHEDLDHFNNRWVNLRLATNGQNMQNGRMYKNNTSGVKGVCRDNGHNAWKAYISVGGTQIKLGRFKSIDDAAQAVTQARVRLHGEFARFN